MPLPLLGDSAVCLFGVDVLTFCCMRRRRDIAAGRTMTLAVAKQVKTTDKGKQGPFICSEAVTFARLLDKHNDQNTCWSPF